MTYNKPELDVENFDIIEEITVSAAGADDSASKGGDVSTASAAAENSIGSDLIIG
jgi:hypothetical protein